ncbi:MAG: S-4TM family putative pore-forming effector [Bacillota bacterium]
MVDKMTLSLSKQNDEWSTTLLAAQRQLYSEARRAVNAQYILAGLVALLGQLMGCVAPEARPIVGLTSILITILNSSILKPVGRNRAKIAASIQEEFDTSTLGLPWNEVLAGRLPEPQTIVEASGRFGGDRSALRDWYGDVTGAPWEIGVLLCQRENLSWNWRLKRTISNLALCYVVGACLISLYVAVVMRVEIATILMALLPWLPFFLLVTDLALVQREEARADEALARQIDSMIEDTIADKVTTSVTDLRRIQDILFGNRSRGHSTPDWLYWRRKNSLQESSRAVREQYLRRARLHT